MTARRIQTLLALVFLGLGGWCLLMPAMVERLALLPEFQHNSATTRLLMGCFGPQAVLCGTVILLSEFKAKTFLVFGLVGSIPFFAFNYYFLFVVQMFTPLMWLDFAGNVAILTLCLWGWRLKRAEIG
ncbi:hypothetical protein GCM10007853_17050 [Algimonas ampicilliniresistens]|uniref:DUF4345 domain-containing protein n=1 Tax=Algimonas ampicilliniresistens TaxID=1298735 RepID=A0ABQ5V8F7_9PROT|nr:hypothetical protein [Algimonas ampicilliniresistens]GLQ23831.1 hypothetical protein GCM10007853_17050 [Algimonas ampicilliniresistens]